MKRWSVLIVVLLMAPVPALTNPTAERAVQMALAPGAAPEPETAGLDALSCQELYLRRTLLMRYTNDYAPRVSDDPRNIAAAYVGTVLTPAFYVLPATAIQDYLRGRKRVEIEAAIMALQRASAARDCFVR